MNARCIVIDYGMGNLHSVVGALKYLGIDPIVSAHPVDIKSADMIILPGVGSFRRAMKVLNETGIADTLREVVLHRQKKILGICLGQQLMATRGTEDGQILGLGFFEGSVERLTQTTAGLPKIPHVGFNKVHFDRQSQLFNGFVTAADFYFVHAYRIGLQARSGLTSITEYGEAFVSAYEYENIYCTQFHPEKSQTNGLRLLSNFLKV